MFSYDIVKFIFENSGEGVHRKSFINTYKFCKEIIDSGQYVTLKQGDELSGVCLYYKVRNLKEVRRKCRLLETPGNFTNGHILYVHTLVIKPGSKNTIWEVAKILRDRELECDTLAYRSAKRNDWFYKIERRREKMRDNCGILAFDNLVKGMNKRANQVSMNTLAHIARDNGVLLFPMKVPNDKLSKLEYPYIVQTNNHFELIEEPVALEGLSLDKEVYLLSPKADTEFIIDQAEAKEIKGAGDMFSSRGAIGQYFSKPARLIPLGISAVGSGFGLPATTTSTLSTLAGLGQAATTGLYGERGSGRALLRGGLSGLGTGAIGRGLGTGFNYAVPSRSPFGDAGSLLGRFGTGFQEGFGSAIPFGQRLGLYEPGASDLRFATDAGLADNNLGLGVNTLNIGGKQTPVVATPASFTEGAPPPGGPVPTTTAAQQPAGAKGILSRLGDFFGIGGEQRPGQPGTEDRGRGSIASSALSLLAGALTPQPEYDVPSAREVFNQQMAQGFPTTFTPEGALAAEQIRKNISEPESILDVQTTQYKDAIIQDLATREERELAYINAKHADNGTYGGSDWMRDVNRVQENFRNETALKMGEIEQNIFQGRVNIYLDSISQAYQMDRANLEAIAGLTNYSLAEAAYRYGLKTQEVADFRKALYEMAAATFPGTQQFE